VIVHLPSKPVPQSEVFTQEAVTAAAEAEDAATAIPPSTTTKALPNATSRRLRSLDIVLPNFDQGAHPAERPAVGDREAMSVDRDWSEPP